MGHEAHAALAVGASRGRRHAWLGGAEQMEPGEGHPLAVGMGELDQRLALPRPAALRAVRPGAARQQRGQRRRARDDPMARGPASTPRVKARSAIAASIMRKGGATRPVQAGATVMVSAAEMALSTLTVPARPSRHRGTGAQPGAARTSIAGGSSTAMRNRWSNPPGMCATPSAKSSSNATPPAPERSGVAQGVPGASTPVRVPPGKRTQRQAAMLGIGVAQQAAGQRDRPRRGRAGCREQQRRMAAIAAQGGPVRNRPRPAGRPIGRDRQAAQRPGRDRAVAVQPPHGVEVGQRVGEFVARLAHRGPQQAHRVRHRLGCQPGRERCLGLADLAARARCSTSPPDCGRRGAAKAGAAPCRKAVARMTSRRQVHRSTLTAPSRPTAGRPGRGTRAGNWWPAPLPRR